MSDHEVKFDLTAVWGGAACSSLPCDPAYPDMEHWALAGVAGGLGQPLPICQRITAGSEQAQIQEALDQVAADGGGAVLLEAGHYVLRETLRIPSGVVLRGAYVDSVKIEIIMRGHFHGFKHGLQGGDTVGILFDQAERAGLEYCTIVFDESVPRPWTVRHQEPGFVDNPRDADDLFVGGVWMVDSAHCWIEGCRIIDAGTSPLVMRQSKHCTARYCEVIGGHNLGGGQSYVLISRSEYCLMAGMMIKDVRHLSIQDGSEEYPCRYNVVIDCDLEVDINFHTGDSGHNLVQDCRVSVPSWHWWAPSPSASKASTGHQAQAT